MCSCSPGAYCVWRARVVYDVREEGYIRDCVWVCFDSASSTCNEGKAVASPPHTHILAHAKTTTTAETRAYTRRPMEIDGPQFPPFAMPCPPRPNQVDKDEDLRFALLVEAFSDADSSGVALITDLVVFFNTILSSAFEFEERVMLRTEMISAGVLEAMQRVRDYFGLSKVRYRRDGMGWGGMGRDDMGWAGTEWDGT